MSPLGFLPKYAHGPLGLTISPTPKAKGIPRLNHFMAFMIKPLAKLLSNLWLPRSCMADFWLIPAPPKINLEDKAFYKRYLPPVVRHGWPHRTSCDPLFHAPIEKGSLYSLSSSTRGSISGLENFNLVRQNQLNPSGFFFFLFNEETSVSGVKFVSPIVRFISFSPIPKHPLRLTPRVISLREVLGLLDKWINWIQSKYLYNR